MISGHVIDGRSIWEPDLVKIFKREIRGGQNVLDVGTNLGLHTILLSRHVSRLGQSGKVFAIKPHPEIFPLTAFNCEALANVECINKAASDVDGACFTCRAFCRTPTPGGRRRGRSAREYVPGRIDYDRFAETQQSWVHEGGCRGHELAMH